MALKRLEGELGEILIDRLGKDLRLTDPGTLVLDFARRFENLRQELLTALAERRDNASGRLTIGANESTPPLFVTASCALSPALSACAGPGAA